MGEWETNLTDTSIGKYSNKLLIEKTGETYKCTWKIEKDSMLLDYLGVGMIVENQLLVARVLLNKLEDVIPRGGIGLYGPTGDSRSYSALWASIIEIGFLGSGIVWREDIGEEFEGQFKVRYVAKGKESPVFNLTIHKQAPQGLYKLGWAIDDKKMYHGVGIINGKKLVFAWGDTNFDWEFVILSLQDDKKVLEGEYGSLSCSSTRQEYCFLHI